MTPLYQEPHSYLSASVGFSLSSGSTSVIPEQFCTSYSLQGYSNSLFSCFTQLCTLED